MKRKRKKKLTRFEQLQKETGLSGALLFYALKFKIIL